MCCVLRVVTSGGRWQRTLAVAVTAVADSPTVAKSVCPRQCCEGEPRSPLSSDPLRKKSISRLIATFLWFCVRWERPRPREHVGCVEGRGGGRRAAGIVLRCSGDGRDLVCVAVVVVAAVVPEARPCGTPHWTELSPREATSGYKLG